MKIDFNCKLFWKSDVTRNLHCLHKGDVNENFSRADFDCGAIVKITQNKFGFAEDICNKVPSDLSVGCFDQTFTVHDVKFCIL